MSKEEAGVSKQVQTRRGRYLCPRWILLCATLLAVIEWLQLPHAAHAFQTGIILTRRPQKSRQYQQQKHDYLKSHIDWQFQLFAAKSDPQEKPAKKGSGKARKNPISHLANDVNLSSLTKNNPTWEQNIAALLEYNQTHGTVNLPALSKEYPNLGRWVHNLRIMKGRLTKDQRQQLDDIGFLWKVSLKEKQDRQWHEMLMKLKAYKENYGDCLVTTGKYSADPKLGIWVMNQRRVHRDKMMSKERKDLLDSIGFEWRLRGFSERDRPDLEELWEKRYQELIEFKEEHSHTNVPKGYPPNKELGHWVNNLRKSRRDGTLSEDRIQRLDEIGFTWEFEPIWEDSWLEQYEKVKTYYLELASYKEMMKNSPEGSKYVAKPMLADSLVRWAANQRLFNAKGALDPERKAMLDDIGFEWKR